MIILYLVTVILLLIFFYSHPIIIAGITLGGVLSIVRFSTNATSFIRLLSGTGETLAGGRGIKWFVINSIVAFLVLAVSIKINLFFFGGVIAGIFFVPIVIIINSITEAIGITHNNFE